MEIRHKRIDGESFIDYKVRLTENKDIYGLTWLQVCDILNEETGEKYTESAYRKEMTNFLRGKNYQIEKSLENGSDVDSENQAILDEINEKLLEIKKEKVKLQTEKIEYNKWIREVSRAELFEEKVIDAIERNMKVLEVPDVSFKYRDRGREGVLLISDIHYGKEFEIQGLDGEILNSYSVEIFEDRMWKLLDATVRNLQKEDVKRIHVFNLADSVEGVLRANSQLMKLKYGITDSIMMFTNFIANWLNKLSEYAIVDYYQNTGNHSDYRIVSGKKGDFPHENAERLIGWALKSMLGKNQNIMIHEEKVQGLIYTNIVGYDILATHGDKEKKLENSIKDYTQLYGKNIDYLLVGHKHFASETVVGINKNIIQAPSLIGIDDYSVSLKKSANSGATMFILNEDYGRSVDYNIVLD